MVTSWLLVERESNNIVLIGFAYTGGPAGSVNRKHIGTLDMTHLIRAAKHTLSGNQSTILKVT